MKISIPFRLMALSAIFTMILMSCEKDKKDNPKGELTLKFDHRFNSETFSLNEEYTTRENEHLTFTTVRYYISNVSLKKADGSWWKEQESYYLIDASLGNPNAITINDIPAGEYTDVRYIIGVDSIRNVSGSQTGALSVTNDMFWSWNSGYIFIKMEGTSYEAPDSNFAYHIGGFAGNNNALQVNTHSAGDHLIKVSPEATPQLHIMVDLKEAFDGHHHSIKVSETDDIRMPGAGAVMFAENFHGAFSLDHVHD